MDESEIILKMAELALSKSRTELFNDALKIGIPSIVAIAGIISAYLLTRSGHKKDLKIENLRVSHDTQKEAHARTGDLVKSISIELIRLHQVMLTYTGSLFVKLDMEKDGLQFPEKSRQELSAHYKAYVDILSESYAIGAQILLLGQKDIGEQFANYRTAVTKLSLNFAPSIGQDMLEKLQPEILSTTDIREKLFESLSDAYLINEKSS